MRPARRGRAATAAREELGLLGVDDLAPLGVQPLSSPDGEAEHFEVTLASDAEAVVVVVESRPSPETVHLTCQAVRPGRVRTWHHLSLTTRPLQPAG